MRGLTVFILPETVLLIKRFSEICYKHTNTISCEIDLLVYMSNAVFSLVLASVTHFKSIIDKLNRNLPNVNVLFSMCNS